MPRCLGLALARNSDADVEEAQEKVRVPKPDERVVQFWRKLGMEERREVLAVNRKRLFTRIREQFCSRCYGLFQLRYEEMKGAAELDCPACQAFYAGLRVGLNGEVVAEERILETDPFSLFAEGWKREKDRHDQFVSGGGDICGSGFVKTKNGSPVCALHSSPVPKDALLEYYKELPQDQRMAIFTIAEDDFAAALDGHLKFQLRICRDCRVNVMRAYRDVRYPKLEEGGPLDICENVKLHVTTELATLHGENAAEFFEKANQVEETKCFDPESSYQNESQAGWRHAETSDAAREALIDSTLLIYKGQVETAFREQTAGHNALLLFVGLTLRMMEEQLMNAYNDITAKQKEAELLDQLDKEKEKEASKQRKKSRKAGRLSLDVHEPSDSSDTTYLPQASHVVKSSPRATHVRHSDTGVSDKYGLEESERKSLESGSHNTDEDEGWEVQSTRRRGSLSGTRRNGTKVQQTDSRGISPDQNRSVLADQSKSSLPLSHSRVTPETSYLDASRPRPASVQGQPPGYLFKGVFIQPPPPPPKEPKTRKLQPKSLAPEEPCSRPNSWKIGTGAALLKGQKNAPQKESEDNVTAWNPWGDWGQGTLDKQLQELRIGANRPICSPRCRGLCSPATVDSEDTNSQTTQSQSDFSLFSHQGNSPGPSSSAQDNTVPHYSLFGATSNHFSPQASIYSL